MPDTFKPISEVQWVEKLVAGRYKVKVPDWMNQYDYWPDWEVARFRSMEELLALGDVLFDVGSETGWISAIYAQFVGAEGMCLFEPTPELWPAIRATWKENGLATPRSTCCALVSDADVHADLLATSLMAVDHGWPAPSERTFLLENVKYNHINEDCHRRPQITLDKFVEISGIEPDAITIDVEGAEYHVLRGAEQTIRRCRPIIWVSVHDQFMVDRYKVWPSMLRLFMESCNYQGNFLAEDHESHYCYVPRA
jgi:FkbM family methyltransferase